jgi:flagellar hook protein FlgE
MAVGSFSAALSGLSAHAQYLSVIGNNLANINTVGFKASAVSFADLVSQSTGTTSVNPAQIGLGVLIGSISPVFSQGSIEGTRETTNAAIQGSGFFIVRSPEGLSYTRAGNFTLNKDGYLVTPDGLYVQGYTQIDPVTGKVVTAGQPGDIVVPIGSLRPPQATTIFRTQVNLDATAAPGATFTTAVQVYDSLGATHVATITYTKQPGAGQWAYQVTVPGAEVQGGVPGTPFVVGSGTLTFNGAGTLLTVNGAAPADVVLNTPAWTNGAAASTWTWDIVDADGGTSLTAFASPSATGSITGNGAAAGNVQGLSIGADGSILASFGGGQSVTIGVIALASFNNPKGLAKLGTNRYSETAVAGLPNVGAPGTGSRGTLIGSAIEQSNVDIAQEFTQMILAQRGYQANSKVITVSDELTVDTLNLKR